MRRTPASNVAGGGWAFNRKLSVCGIIVVCAWAGALWAWHPSELGWIPACPSRVLVGWICPGCGSLRAAHHLLHLRVGEALRHNALAVALGAPALAFVVWSMAHVAVRGRGARGVRAPGWAGWGVLALVVAFGVLRNVGWSGFDVFRPPGPASRGASGR